MDLRQFKNINVRQLPIFDTTSDYGAWVARRTLPSEFFLHNEDHIVLVALSSTSPTRTAFIYDSLGLSMPIFQSFLMQHACIHRVECYFIRPLQRAYDSDTCTIHAVLFSLGYQALAASNDFILKQYLKPVLEVCTNQIKSTVTTSTLKHHSTSIPFWKTASCLKLARPHLTSLLTPPWSR